MTKAIDTMFTHPQTVDACSWTSECFGRSEEALRARRYPISRWCLRPMAGWLAIVLTPTRVRPVHLTACGFASACLAAGVLLLRPETGCAAAVLVLAAWFFDRADGLLARRQGTATAWGAWLDANVDELVDVGLHVAVAAVAASQAASSVPWFLLIALLVGKYLFMHGLAGEEHAAARATVAPGQPVDTGAMSTGTGWLRAAYHLPANADVRVHLLAAALATGWLCTELALVAAYYNLRWIARYALVARRMGVRG